MNRILSFIVLVLVVGCEPPPEPPPDGPFEEYHENGQLMMKGTYKDRELNGPFERYDRNGELLDRGTLRDGKECGEWLEEGEAVTYDPC